MNSTDIHPIQSQILCELLFVTEAGFAKLNINKLGSDLFSFHLRQLVDWKLIEKNDGGKYCLTTKGKEYANRFDTKNKEVERQPKLAVLLVAVRESGGSREYLIQRRLKQPYYGFWGFVSGKVRWGETVEEAAARELKEETGLGGKVALTGLKHKMDYDQNGQLLEDKYFLVFRADKLEGELIEKFEGGENYWKRKGEILGLKNLFDGVNESMEMIDQKYIELSENKYRVNGY